MMKKTVLFAILTIAVVAAGTCHADGTWDFELVNPDQVGALGDTLIYEAVISNWTGDFLYLAGGDLSLAGLPFASFDWADPFLDLWGEIPVEGWSGELFWVELPSEYGTWDGSVALQADQDWSPNAYPEWTGPVEFTATAVPEPMTAALLGVGLVGLAGLRRRKARGAI